MMNNKLIFILLVAMTFSMRAAMADPVKENYVGVQYGMVSYEEDEISEEYKPTAVVGRFGHFFMPQFSVEGRLGFGLQDDTRFLRELGDGFDVTLDLDTLYGIYATGHLNITESSSIYAVLGASKVEATVTVPAFPSIELKGDESSVSYGVGADIGIGSNITLNVEYMMYLDKTNFDLSMLGVGVAYNF